MPIPTFPNNWVYGDRGCCTNTLSECTLVAAVADPVISPQSQSFFIDIEVTITDSTSGALIYYTIDGSTPTSASTLYTVPFTLTETAEVKAIAIKEGLADSNVVSQTYTHLQDTVATPIIDPTSEDFFEPLTITITCATVGATIYYTIDGSTPGPSSLVYSGPFDITVTTTIKAIGILAGYNSSNIVTEIYNEVVFTPEILPDSTGFTGSLAVTITCATVGATIYYTTNGSTPTSGSTPYVGSFNVTATTTVKAIAILGGLSNSAIASETYTLNPSVMDVYWGYSPNLTLNEAEILALQDTASESDPYRNYIFDASSTVNDYFYWWWPSSFGNPGTTDGFEDAATVSPMAMATNTEGFTDGPVNGWYYLNVTVDGVAGRLWRSYFQLGGGGAFTATVNN